MPIGKICQKHLSMQIYTDSFLHKGLFKNKGAELVPVSFFVEFFDKILSFVILRKLAKFHY